MPPFIHFLIDFEGLGTARMLRDDNLGATLVENCDDRVAVERFILEQRTEIYSLDQRLNANGFEALSWQQDKADQIAECMTVGCNARSSRRLPRMEFTEA